MPVTDAAAPRVSVIIPIYNQATYLRRAVDSILTQSMGDLELILIDDGSQDDSAGIIDDYARRDWRVVGEHQLNCGISSALNRGLAISRGTYIARLDGDDISLPDRLAKQVAYLDAHPEIGILGGGMILIDSRDRKLTSHRYVTGMRAVRAALASGTVIPGPAGLLRRDLCVALGGWRTPFDAAEDYDFCLRLSERAELENMPDYVTYYRVHAQQTTQLHWRRQNALAEVARIAARFRREGRPDPITPDMRIDASTIDRLGLDGPETERVRALFPAASP
jgi:glycosyltransferase involved in cell wall biosynthesis